MPMILGSLQDEWPPPRVVPPSFFFPHSSPLFLSNKEEETWVLLRDKPPLAGEDQTFLLPEDEEAVTGFSACCSSSACVRLCLCAMLSVSWLCNFDHGALPALLADLSTVFHLSYFQLSVVGALVYSGLIVGTLLAGLIYQRLRAKWLLVGSLMLLAGSLYSLSFCTNIYWMYGIRFCSGLFQALPVVYLPVWVDEFAPDGKTGRWMAFMQLAAIAGTVSGYLVAGMLSPVQMSFIQSWRVPFLLQATLLAPVCLVLGFVPGHFIDIKMHRRRRLSTISLESTDDNSFRSFLRETWRDIKTLLQTPLYVIITLAMSNLYFVVTGVQFWVTEYMTMVLHHDKILTVSLSTFCFFSAPTAGVTLGGVLSDSVEGYGIDAQAKRIRIGTILAGFASLCAIASLSVVAVLPFISLLWGCLFCGASLVPLAVSLNLCCVPSHLRSLSSAVSQLSYNLFGWFSAPLLSGALMEVVGCMRPDLPHEAPLKIGFGAVLILSLFGFILFLIANLAAIPGERSNNIELSKLRGGTSS